MYRTFEELLFIVILGSVVFAQNDRRHHSHNRHHISRSRERDARSRSLRHTDAMWTTWSHWTPCSMSCDQGTRSRYRGCVQSTASGLKRVDAEQCQGMAKQYEICQVQPCSDNDYLTPREHQCAQYNTDVINDNTYMWIPFQSDSTHCDLSCIAVGFAFIDHFGHVTDGTPCTDLASSTGVSQNKVCIGGQCRVVGCDGIVDSGAVVDKCKVCGGENADCFLYRNSFLTLDPPTEVYHEYQEIVRIPEGATYIEVTDLSPNYLALKDGNTYILNGYRVIDWPGTFEVSGTKIVYERNGMAEILTIEGPTTRNLTLMLLFKERNPGVHFEFYLPPLKANQIVVPEQENGKNGHPPYIPPPLLPPTYGTAAPARLPNQIPSEALLKPFEPSVAKPKGQGMEIPLAKPLVPGGVNSSTTQNPELVHDEWPANPGSQGVNELQRDPHSYDSPFLLALQSETYDNFGPEGIPLAVPNTGTNFQGASSSQTQSSPNSRNLWSSWNNNYNYALYGPPPELPPSGSNGGINGNPQAFGNQGNVNWDQYYRNYLARGPPPSIPERREAFPGQQDRKLPLNSGPIYGNIIYDVNTREFLKVLPNGDRVPATSAEIQNPSIGASVVNEGGPLDHGLTRDQAPTYRRNGQLPPLDPSSPLALQHGNNPLQGSILPGATGRVPVSGTPQQLPPPQSIQYGAQPNVHSGTMASRNTNSQLFSPNGQSTATGNIINNNGQSISGSDPRNSATGPSLPHVPDNIVSPPKTNYGSTPSIGSSSRIGPATPVQQTPQRLETIVLHPKPIPPGLTLPTANPVRQPWQPTPKTDQEHPGSYNYYDADFVLNNRRRNYLDYYRNSRGRPSNQGTPEQQRSGTGPWVTGHYAQNYQVGNPVSEMTANKASRHYYDQTTLRSMNDKVEEEEILDWTDLVEQQEFVPVQETKETQKVEENQVIEKEEPILHFPVSDFESFGEDEVFDYINELIAKRRGENVNNNAAETTTESVIPPTQPSQLLQTRTETESTTTMATTSTTVITPKVEPLRNVPANHSAASNRTCPRCHKVKNMKENFCKSQLVARVTVKSSRIVQGVIRYAVTLQEVFRRKGFLSYNPDYIWTFEKCRCPKLKRNQDYLVMGNVSQDGKFQMRRDDYSRNFKTKYYQYITNIVRTCPDLNCLH